MKTAEAIPDAWGHTMADLVFEQIDRSLVQEAAQRFLDRLRRNGVH
jgi:hypothetical protein